MKNFLIFFILLNVCFFIQSSEKRISPDHSNKINLLVLENQKKVYHLQKEQEKILKKFDTQMSYKIKNASTMQEKNNIREVYAEMRDIIIHTYEMWEFSVYQNTAQSIYELHEHKKRNLLY